MATDRENRIAARRARIAARLRAAKATQSPDSAKEVTQEEKRFNFVRSQGLASTLLKAKLKQRVVTLQNLCHDRAFKQVYLNAARYEELNNFSAKEDEGSKTAEQETKLRDALVSINVPQDLFQRIEGLCKVYESIVQSKTKIIDKIYEELKLKDEEYSLLIKQQAQDVNGLISVMNEQTIKLRNFYLQELDHVESTLLSKRKTLLENNKSEMTILIQERQDVEVKYHEEIQICKEKFIKLLNDIREDDIDDFNALKIKLEKDIQNLEQHLQNMQAVYQLNAEKLDYNFLVLIEREHENYIMSNQQKKKLTKQRDALSNIKGRHHDLEKQFIEHNEKLTDDYARVTRLLRDLQRKEQNLQLIHASIHKRFFFMHQHTISSLTSRVLQADKRIHEDELGWRWRYPSDSLFVMLGSRQPVKEKSTHQSEEGGSQDKAIVIPLWESLANEKYQVFINSLIKEAGFLIDKESTEIVISLHPDLHQRAWCAIILQALGIDSSTALEKLYAALTDKMGEDDGLATSHLKSYLQGENAKLLHSNEIPSHGQQLRKEQNAQLRLEARQVKQRSLRFQWDRYWNSFTTVISPKVLRVWKHLESALVNYNQILKDRLLVSKEVLLLKQRNQKLQETLQYCLSSKETL